MARIPRTDPAARPTLFGSLLRESRLAARLTQAELGRRSGVPQSRLSGFESGHETDVPRRDTIMTLAAALECDPTPLLAAAGRIPHDVQERLMQSPAWIAYIRTHPDVPPL